MEWLILSGKTSHSMKNIDSNLESK